MRFIAGVFTVHIVKLDLVLIRGSNKEDSKVLKEWMGRRSTKAVVGQCSMKIFSKYNFILVRGREES